MPSGIERSVAIPGSHQLVIARASFPPETSPAESEKLSFVPKLSCYGGGEESA